MRRASQPGSLAGKEVHMASVSSVADHFLQALAQRDFSALTSCFDEGTHFRALVPKGLREATSASDAAGYFRQWFGGAERFDLIHSDVEFLAARQHWMWRFDVQRAGERQVVEQQAFASIADGRIVRMELVCSGFQPFAPLEDHDVKSNQRTLPLPDDVLDAAGEDCATLTPLLAAHIRKLGSKRILEVWTDDPAAIDSLPAWCRLTGHELLAVDGAGSERQRFFIRAK